MDSYQSLLITYLNIHLQLNIDLIYKHKYTINYHI